MKKIIKGGKSKKGHQKNNFSAARQNTVKNKYTNTHERMCVFRMTDSPPPIPQEGKNTFLFISMIPLFFVNVMSFKQKNCSDSTRDTTQEKIYLYHGMSSLYSHPRSNNHSKTSNNQSPLQKGYKLQSLTSRVG